jgi:hypothetical protein
MQNILSRRATKTTLAIACGVLLAGGAYLMWINSVQRLRISFADEQTQTFEDSRTRALESSDRHDIAKHLSYVVSYYPSGSKQEQGSRLDGIVERSRAAAIRDIVAHLRSTPGDDLGPDTVTWIQKYAAR